MTPYTPGPWTNDNGLVCGRDSKLDAPSFDIFDAAEWNGDEVEGHANARLIAASPEMFDFIHGLATDRHDRVSPGLKARASQLVAKVIG